MNCTVYVFGNLGGGYMQRPDDYTQEIFRNFHAKSTAVSQITIHRDNSLMYYGYVRRLDADGQYIGFCILLNGVMFSRIGGLFSVFENAVTDLISGGKIIGFSDNGGIVAKAGDLSSIEQEAERVAFAIRQAATALEGDVRLLPPVSYGMTNDASMRFSVSDRDENIVEATGKYGYTCICRDVDSAHSAAVEATGEKGIAKEPDRGKYVIVDRGNGQTSESDIVRGWHLFISLLFVIFAFIVLLILIKSCQG